MVDSINMNVKLLSSENIEHDDAVEGDMIILQTLRQNIGKQTDSPGENTSAALKEAAHATVQNEFDSGFQSRSRSSTSSSISANTISTCSFQEQNSNWSLSESTPLVLTNAALSKLSESVKHLREENLLLKEQFSSLSESLPDIKSTDRKIPSFLTFISILGLINGTSTLAIPFLVANGGPLQLISIIVLGYVSYYTCCIILDCQRQESNTKPNTVKRVYETYIDIGKAALPKRFGGPFMKALTFSSLLSDVYVFILMGTATKEMLSSTIPSLGKEHWILIIAAGLIPALFMTKLSIITWLSTVSVVLWSVDLAIIFCFVSYNWEIWDPKNLTVSFSTQYLFIGYGVIVNSNIFHWVVPSLEGSMKHPASLKKVLTADFVISIIVKLSFSCLVVLTFGAKTEQSATSNLVVSSTVSMIVNICVLLGGYFYLPLGMYVVFEMCDLYFLPYFPVFKRASLSYWIWVGLTRLLIILFVIFLAVLVPQYGIVVSVIGNIRGSMVAIAVPCYCHFKLKHRHISLSYKIFDLSLIGLSFVFGVGGAYYSTKFIANSQ